MTAPIPTIVTEFSLYRKQYDFHRSTALYRCFMGGRGSGKSKAGSFDLAMRAEGGHAYLVGSPTGVKLRDETFPTFKAVAEELGVWPGRRGVKLTPYPTVTLTTGAEIRFRTLDDPEMARGPNLAGAWLDEGSLMPRTVFTVVIGCLRDGMKLGWLTVTCTPKGKRHWTHIELGTGKPNSALFRAATYDNPFIPPEFADNLRYAYTRAEAEQEIEGKVVDEGDQFAVIPEEWIRLAMERWTSNGATGRLQAVGLDPARGGPCYTTIAKRYGSWFAPIVTIPGRETPDGDSAAAEVRKAIMGDEHVLINVDTFGVGADAYGSLCRMGLNAASINGGVKVAATDRTGTLTFANLRSFGYWSLRELLDPTKRLPNDPPPQLPPDDELAEELIEHRWNPVGGQVQVEKKEEISKRLKGGRSPDKADALMLSILLPMAV